MEKQWLKKGKRKIVENEIYLLLFSRGFLVTKVQNIFLKK